MEEWRVVVETPSGVQTVLNQWRHRYTICIFGMSTRTTPAGELEVTVLLNRTKKKEEDK